MDWHSIAIGAGIAVGFPLVGFLWQSFLKREKTFAWGKRAGKAISFFLGQKLGKERGHELEGRFETTAQDFFDGMKEGLAADDK